MGCGAGTRLRQSMGKISLFIRQASIYKRLEQWLGYCNPIFQFHNPGRDLMVTADGTDSSRWANIWMPAC